MKAFRRDASLMRPLNIIVAVDEEGGFGKDGKIPWKHPEDLKHFQSTTMDSTCIMGRKTYQDMYDMVTARKVKNKKKENDKPIQLKDILPGRECFVISRTLDKAQGAQKVNNIREAVERSSRKEIFIIGGESIYTEALPWTHIIYLTLVKGRHNCDRFFAIKYLKENFQIHKGKRLSDDILSITYTRSK